jgi:CubicO group peptidase (beta-lactamase class C family)
VLLPETSRRVDQLVARCQASGRSPIVAASVWRDGAVAHLAAAGAPVEETGNLQFRIGSITKTMAAVLVMQLRDAGELSLDDLLYRHLPGTPVGSNVTLRQLLGHASGLQREPDGGWWERMDGADVEKLLGTLTPDKLFRPPLAGYHYSNLAYGLLGAVLDRITGISFAELVTQRILAPLGMHRTSYHPADPFAAGYVVHPWLDTMREEPRTDTGAMAPAGQLWSTPVDLATWAGFLAEPDPAVLAPATLTEMCAPVVMSDLDTWSDGHGLGLELYRRGERVYVGHGGSMPGYLANVATHRRSRTGIVVFANAYTLRGTSIQRLCLEVLDAVLDSEPELPAPWRPAPGAPSAQIEALLGRWWWMGREYEATLDHASGELVIGSLSRPRSAMRFVPESADRWRGVAGENDGETLEIIRDADGTPVTLDIATFLFTRSPMGPEG